ncbi:MAG: extensin-like domain-containing protein [Polyangiales bacterium]
MADQGSARSGVRTYVRVRILFFALALASCDPAAPLPPRVVGKSASVASATKASMAVASTSASAAPVVPRSPFAYANIDPDDDLVVAPPDVRDTCEADLKAAGIAYEKASLKVHVAPKSKITCGAPQVVMYRKSPEKIAYSPSVMTTCTMALALARFETILQAEAKKSFGKKVVKIHHVGTYSCREMAAYPGWVSEHSYANAIDLVDFVLEDGRTIEVLKDFAPKTALGTTTKATFLRAVTQRAFDEEVFSSVLTPFFDKLHANHFHLDMARFRSDGSRPLSE